MVKFKKESLSAEQSSSWLYCRIEMSLSSNIEQLVVFFYLRAAYHLPYRKATLLVPSWTSFWNRFDLACTDPSPKRPRSDSKDYIYLSRTATPADYCSNSAINKGSLYTCAIPFILVVNENLFIVECCQVTFPTQICKHMTSRLEYWVFMEHQCILHKTSLQDCPLVFRSVFPSENNEVTMKMALNDGI